MHTSRLAPPVLLAGLAAALAACAGTPPAASRATLLSEARHPALDRGCRVAAKHEELPAPEALVDAAALRADAARLWSAAGRPAGYALFSLRYDRDGTNVRRALIEHDLPPEMADSLQALVFAHRKTAAPAKEEWGVRLRVDLGEESALRVGRREVCAPAPRDWAGRVAGTSFDVRDRFLASFGPPSAADLNTVWVRVRLDARGYVTEARVERGMTRGMAESRLLNYVRTLVFVPATEDGYPVAGETSLPFRVPL